MYYALSPALLFYSSSQCSATCRRQLATWASPCQAILTLIVCSHSRTTAPVYYTTSTLPPPFITEVKEYVAIVGLRLNVHKTHIFPFSPFSPPVRHLDVVADNRSVRFFGFYVSPSLPTSSRFPRVLEVIVTRCKLWRYRARTLIGPCSNTSSIVLPILWSTAAVTIVPAAVALQVKRLCKSFLFRKDISNIRNFKDPKAEEWLYIPTSKGGLDLPETTAFCRALQICSLRDAMCKVTSTHVVPRWFTAAFTLISKSLFGGGSGFDILYAPIPRGLTIPDPWVGVATFWTEPLRVWNTWLTRHYSLDNLSWATTELPYWQNHLLRANKAGRLTSRSSQNAHLFISAGYARLQDFIDRHAALPTMTSTGSCTGSLISDENLTRHSGSSQNPKGEIFGAVEKLLTGTYYRYLLTSTSAFSTMALTFEKNIGTG